MRVTPRLCFEWWLFQFFWAFDRLWGDLVQAFCLRTWIGFRWHQVQISAPYSMIIISLYCHLVEYECDMKGLWSVKFYFLHVYILYYETSFESSLVLIVGIITLFSFHIAWWGFVPFQALVEDMSRVQISLWVESETSSLNQFLWLCKTSLISLYWWLELHIQDSCGSSKRSCYFLYNRTC